MKSEYVFDDFFRITGTREQRISVSILRKDAGFRFMYYWRKSKESNSFFLNLYYRFRLHTISVQNGIEIPLSVEIGPGAQIIHPYGITINSKAKIGRNLTILKGSTIGNVKSGKNAGTPVIGDNVYIGLNAAVIGNITIGDDVLIAANSFVNFCVPPHSVVIGNPGVIHSKMDATKDYILHTI